MKDTKKLGLLIQKLRLENDLSLRGLAERSGVSYSFINSIEHDRFKGSRETIIAIADALKGANKDQLLLLAGFAPDNPSSASSSTDDELNVGRAFLGGVSNYTEEEIELAKAAARAAVEAYRKAQKKKDK